MKWKKLVTLGCVVVMTVSSVTACGSNTTENQTVEATEQSEENQSDSVIVQVTAVTVVHTKYRQQVLLLRFLSY